MEKSLLIDLDAETPTGGKQAKAVQPERLSGETPKQIMLWGVRQSGLVGNQLLEGRSKNFPRYLLRARKGSMFREFCFQGPKLINIFFGPTTSMIIEHVNRLTHNFDFLMFFGRENSPFKNIKNTLNLAAVLNLPNKLFVVCVDSAVTATYHFARFMRVNMTTKIFDKVFKHLPVIFPLDDTHTHTATLLHSITIFFHCAVSKPSFGKHFLLPNVNHEIAFTPKESAKLSKPSAINIHNLLLKRCGYYNTLMVQQQAG